MLISTVLLCTRPGWPLSSLLIIETKDVIERNRAPRPAVGQHAFAESVHSRRYSSPYSCPGWRAEKLVSLQHDEKRAAAEAFFDPYADR